MRSVERQVQPQLKITESLQRRRRLNLTLKSDLEGKLAFASCSCLEHISVCQKCGRCRKVIILSSENRLQRGIEYNRIHQNRSGSIRIQAGPAACALAAYAYASLCIICRYAISATCSTQPSPQGADRIQSLRTFRRAGT